MRSRLAVKSSQVKACSQVKSSQGCELLIFSTTWGRPLNAARDGALLRSDHADM